MYICGLQHCINVKKFYVTKIQTSQKINCDVTSNIFNYTLYEYLKVIPVHDEIKLFYEKNS